jgi:hypothetical protein
MYYRLIFLALVLVLASSSCRRLPNVQGEGAALVQGIWGQDSTAHADKLLSYTRHQFRFSCDSFYVDLTTHSKVNYYEDSCFNNGIWKEYAKGVYTLRNDSLFLEGTYTKANYKQKVSGCYNNGRYIKAFLIQAKADSSMTLMSLNDQREVQLSLKEKTTCIPQKL